MTAFLASFIFVFLAEMGDKTQLLAMAFAARFRAHKVLLAVFIATALNHALAVAAGRYLAAVIPLDIISLLASASFIVFGLWTVRGDTLAGEDRREPRFGPVVTVGIAFFLAEMGDKTQLATVSLAVQYGNALAVLAGTTLAMVAADAAGIVIGVIMHRHLPQAAIRWISASLFMLFGFVGIHRVVSGLAGRGVAWAVLAVTMVSAALCARALVKGAGRRGMGHAS